MPCSHCGGVAAGGPPGHNRATCSAPGAEEARRERIENNARRQRERQAVEERARLEARARERRERERQCPPFHIYNDNDYSVSVYFKRLEAREGGVAPNSYSHWMDIPHFGNSSIRQDTHNAHLIFLPTEVCLNGTHQIPKDNLSLDEIQQLFTVTDLTIGQNNVYQRPNNELYLIRDFTPKKSEVQQWRECGLKSLYLLDQLIKLGAKSNDTYESILDLVQDIPVPRHEQIDRENAGVPSAFTNITTETGINPPEE
jgi:hypothetical protein